MSDSQRNLQTVLLVVTWSGCSLSVLLAIYQLALHCTVPRSRSWAHSLNLLAVPCLLAHAVVSTILIDPGAHPAIPCTGPDPSQPHSALVRWDYRRLQVAENSVFWTGLWALKLSCIPPWWPLITDRRGLSPWPRRILYAATSVTVLLYVACLVSPIAMLGSWRANHDCGSPAILQRITVGLSVSASVSVGDGIIWTALPTMFIMSIRHSMRRTQWIRLASSPALQAFILAIALVRVVGVIAGRHSLPPLAMLTSSAVSLNVANVICGTLSIERLRSIRQHQADNYTQR